MKANEFLISLFMKIIEKNLPAIKNVVSYLAHQSMIKIETKSNRKQKYLLIKTFNSICCVVIIVSFSIMNVRKSQNIVQCCFFANEEIKTRYVRGKNKQNLI
jgi:hypothetical protein